MKILFLGLAIPSLDNSLKRNLYTELIWEFHKNNHEITLVAPALDKDMTGLQIENGIPVVRVNTLKLFGANLIVKGLSNLLLPFQFKRMLKKSGIDLHFDLVILPTPPITLVSIAKWLKSTTGSRVYLLLRDIFPQNAVDLKLMKKNGFAYKYFRNMEKETYKVADSIGCMSQGNIDYVLDHNSGVDESKLHLLPNWGELRPLITDLERDVLRKKYGLENKFIVIFGGNFGLPQKIENMVALVKSCEDYKNIHFLFIGSGTRVKFIKEWISDNKSSNITMIDKRLDANEYFNLLQASDVGLISLSEEFTIPNIPYKTVAYFNAKKPVLASTDEHTDLKDILKRSGAGLWAQAGNTSEVKQQLLKLYKDPELRKTMGENGYKYFEDNLLTSFAVNTIISEILK